jgi:hypothetical protein
VWNSSPASAAAGDGITKKLLSPFSFPVDWMHQAKQLIG